MHFIVLALPMYGMDPVPIPDDGMIAWKIILEHGVQWFDYRIIHSLMLNKRYKTLLKATAECRRSYLSQLLDLKSNNLVWHKYGAMCGRAYFEFTELYIRRFYLHSTGWQHQPPTVFHGKFNRCLPYEPAAYFNNKGAFCFYTCSTDWRNKETGSVFKEVWPSHRVWPRLGLYTQRCVTNIIDDKGKFVELKEFLEFPRLLKAFLKSCITYSKKYTWEYDKKIYAIEGVKIPRNYKEHKQYFPAITYASFDDLPKVVRKAVVARYKAQGKIAAEKILA